MMEHKETRFSPFIFQRSKDNIQVAS